MSTKSTKAPGPGFFARLAIAAAHILIPLHTGMIVTYFILQAMGGNPSGFVEVLGFVLPWLFIPSLVLLPLALWQGSNKIMLLAGLPFALFLFAYGQLFLPGLPAAKPDHTFTVMSYNVYFENTHSDQIIAVIETYDPDIIGFHEFYDSAAEIEKLLAEEYPYYRIEPEGRGIFSRYPIENYTTFIMDGYSTRLAQQCVLNIDGHKTTLISVHPAAPPVKSIHPFGLPLTIPLGANSENRDAHLDSLLSHLKGVRGPLLLIGDFNLSDQEPYYKKITQGLQDAHRESGWGLGFTFTRFLNPRIPIWRIDYVFHSPEIVSLHTTVGDYGGSDHRPVIAQLGFDERERD